MEKTEIILQTDGSFVERLVSERTLNAGQSVLDTLTENITRQIRNVFNIPGWGLSRCGLTGICLNGNGGETGELLPGSDRIGDFISNSEAGEIK